MLLLLLALEWNLDWKHLGSAPGGHYCIEEKLAAAGRDSSWDFGLLGVPHCKSKKEVAWSKSELLLALRDFIPLYESRPIKQYQRGVLGLDHSFGLWFLARRLQPESIIESGGHRGHSTWILRRAVPDARIIALGTEHPSYVHANTIYVTRDNDFGNLDWDNLLNPSVRKTKILLVFDDHQNQFKRVLQAKNAGFQHLIFANNSDTGSGEAYSLRQVCDQQSTGGGHNCSIDSREAAARSQRKKSWDRAIEISEICSSKGEWWGVRGQMRDKPDRASVYITHRDHASNHGIFESMLQTYWELPPVASPGLSKQRSYDPARTPPPLLGDEDSVVFDAMGLSQLEPWQFGDYSQLVYVRLDG
ncbi:hypothetical protein SELMODRAFT_121604 [Selaginella moellendorffii]|uniref:Uncharacterized protein n=1 Tax=Selaginella moellendorffii TaxID=88036 RepID=D8SP22_SELML|nr:hypothetical protein SELMODRAFT_121604 [Selaginella moellendorffii]